MITSMTGYGHGEAESEGIAVSVELRSVNNRFLDVVARLPRSLALRENDIKEIVRKVVLRGKINLTVTIQRGEGREAALRLDPMAAKAYFRLLNDLRKTLRLKQTVKIEHLLQFSEIFQPQELENADQMEWKVTQVALGNAITELTIMRRTEGTQLQADFHKRLDLLSSMIDRIEELSKEQVPHERIRLRERITQLIENWSIDPGRLELEISLLADKLDVTEECVRFRSHVKFFRQAIASDEAAGRKLNFLIQEMNREVNTMGSKSNDSEIAHQVVHAKEELEKVREQLQNVE
jgi:uncharacterized protein (TIGR00255 family)